MKTNAFRVIQLTSEFTSVGFALDTNSLRNPSSSVPSMKPFPGDWRKEDKNFNFSPKVFSPSVHRAGQKGRKRAGDKRKPPSSFRKKGFSWQLRLFCV
jgi:hypothetical protein